MMNRNSSTKKRIEWRNLVWLGGPEGAALGAVILAIPFIVSRLWAIYRARKLDKAKMQ